MKPTHLIPTVLALAWSLLLSWAPGQTTEIRKARDLNEPAAVAAKPVPAAPMVVPTVRDSSDNYRVRANDELSVKVFQEPDLSDKCIVLENGTVRLPLIDEVVKVGGLTITEIENRIRILLAKDYVRDPRVTVTMVKMSKVTFTVMGQVNKAGRFEMPSNKSTNVLEAIGMAGGFTRLANQKEVYLKRMVGGQEKVSTINVKEMARNPKGTVYLQEGDVLTVIEAGF